MFSLEPLNQSMWNFKFMIKWWWGIHVLNFNLIGWMVCQPELFKFFDMGYFCLFYFFLNKVHLAVPGCVWGKRRSSWNVNPIQVPPDDVIFAFSLFHTNTTQNNTNTTQNNTNTTQNNTHTTQNKFWRGSAISDCSFSCFLSYFDPWQQTEVVSRCSRFVFISYWGW